MPPRTVSKYPQSMYLRRNTTVGQIRIEKSLLLTPRVVLIK